MNTKRELESPYDLINEYAKSLKGFEKLKWTIACKIDDVHVWIYCKWFNIFKRN